MPLLALIFFVAAVSACVKPISNSSSTGDPALFSSSNEGNPDPPNSPNSQEPDQTLDNTPGAPSSGVENSLNEDENNPFILHTVEEGETLGIIARLYDTTPEELILFNQIEDINLIFAGDVLRIPGPDFESVISPRLR